MFLECKGTTLFVLLYQFAKTWTNMDEKIDGVGGNSMEEHFFFEEM